MATSYGVEPTHDTHAGCAVVKTSYTVSTLPADQMRHLCKTVATSACCDALGQLNHKQLMLGWLLEPPGD